MRIKTPFAWFGGKTTFMNWYNPIIESIPHITFVDLFGGSGTVILNKKPSKVDVYNDIYGDVVNFFRVLRRTPQELISLLELTPYAREEYVDCLNRDGCSDLERARRFFVVARQVCRGLATTASEGRWCFIKNLSRKGKSLVVSRWLSAIEGLEEFAGRLRDIQIECLDYRKCLDKYDSTQTLFFCDPPYLPEVRPGGKAYKFEFVKDDHVNLLNKLKVVKGRALLCGYDNELYNENLVGWQVIKGKLKKAASTNFKDSKVKQEILWVKG